MAIAQQSGGYVARPNSGGGGGLAEVIDIILDKGLVIDAYVRVSLIGIEILTIDARIVIASVDTYLRFAEAVGPARPPGERRLEGPPRVGGGDDRERCQLQDEGRALGREGSARPGDDDDEDDKKQRTRARRTRSRSDKGDE